MLRNLLKRIKVIRNSYVYVMDVWSDLRLYLLTMTGYVPFHSYRNHIYRLSGLRIEPTSSLHWRARFFCPEGVVIGKYTTIGNDAFFDGRDTITIGDSVNIASEVRVYTRQHDIDAEDFGEIGGPVVIEDYAYIGSRVTILPGVTVGYGSVVASGSVVTKDVEQFTMVGGVPAKPIRKRSSNLNYRLGYAKRFQ